MSTLSDCDMVLNYKYLFVSCILLAGASLQEVTWGRDPWIDPTTDTYLTLTSTATGSVRVGDVVNYTCTATGMTNTNRLLLMTEVIEDYRIEVLKDYNPMVYTKVIEAADNGKEIVCHTTFYNQHGYRSYPYNVYSDKIKIVVDGVTNTATKPAYAFGQGATISSSVSVTTHRVGDSVEYECEVTNVSANLLELRQVKGNYEFTVYTGFQSWRFFSWVMEASDNDTSIYCLVSTTMNGWPWVSYTIESPRIPINVT